MKYREDYKTAGVPMLAVVRGRAAVGLQVILYAWATVACSLLLTPVADMGIVYTVVALASGAWFIYETHRLYNLAIRHEHVSPMRVFHGSIAYLTILSLAIAIDPLVHFPL
jgi:protoheme IX farnesyltransferase